MKLLTKIEKTKDCWFLIGVTVVFFLLRLPSFIEPYWYGDEGIYQVIGIALNENRLLYKDIWDNKPPLLYIIYALFSSDQFSLRVLSFVFGILAVFTFYLISKKLLKAEKAVFLSVGFFALLFGLPLLEGNIANAENFMLLPIILAGFLIYNYTLNAKPYTLIIAGFFLSLAFLFKIVAIFDFAAFTLFLIYIEKNSSKSINQIIKHLMLFFAAFAVPLFLTAAFFFFKGAFTPFLEATLRQNIGYVSYGNRLLIPQGLLLLKLFFLFSGSIFLFKKRNLFSSSELFIFIWFIFSLFNTFFSQRPYTHYLLILLPSFSLMLGLFLTENKTKAYKKIVGLMLFFTIIIVGLNFTFYTKIFSYYENYLSFVANKKSVAAYQSFFDKHTPADYAIASYLKTHMEKNDTVFIWGNNGQVYALLNELPPGRFIVAYHITSSPQTLAETQIAINKIKPTFIVSSHNQSIPFSIKDYQEQIMIYDAQVYEKKF
ncbi:MAG: glycosyltransferase family 39 protein [Candidatus Levyibacteriota bacterium]|nr:MAG: glycosyltransferase family 39 protein [Candidatus Levybacteria bacterium]